MIKLYEAAHRLQEFCAQRGWKFCFIGGLAVLRWGRIRFTHDVDMTLLTGFGQEEHFLEDLTSAYAFRAPCNPEFALRARVALLQDASGIPLDVAFGAIPFEERSVERSTMWDADTNVSLRTCSAEDLLVHKCFANRTQDWADVENILARQVGRLNLEQVRNELRPLVALKEDGSILPAFESKVRAQSKPFSRTPPNPEI